uniref:Phage protein n=1 Tax=Angiostrongylus cantonensis TaxID=6313 RepID=A0A0K0CTG5_ANGCA
MKYGKQQMVLIRKRMKIENWIDAEVAKLFNGNEDNVGYSYHVVSTGKNVTPYTFFSNHCPASMDKITMFLDEMIDQLKTL